jgi:hypothetical protein
LFPELKTLKGRRFQILEDIQENAVRELHHHTKCVQGSIPTMEETFEIGYRQ